MLRTMLATKRLHSPGIRPGWFVSGVGSRSTGRLAGHDCQGVRRVGMGWEAVGFTYEMLPRACEGSLRGPAWCVVVCVCISTQLVCSQRRETRLSDKVHVRSCCFSKQCPHAGSPKGEGRDPGSLLDPTSYSSWRRRRSDTNPRRTAGLLDRRT